MKRCTIIALCFMLLFPEFIVKAKDSGADYIFFNYKSFTDMGTWTAYETASRYNGYSIPLKAEKTENAEDACAYFCSDKDGTYTVWVRCMYPGTGDRRFRVGLNNGVLPQTVNNTVDTEGTDYKWIWEKAGEVYIRANTVNKLRLIAYASVYSRCDALLLTDDADYIPPDANDEIKKLEAYIPKAEDKSGYQGDVWKENSYFYNFDSVSNQGTWQIYQWDEYEAEELRYKFSDRILRGHQLLSPQISNSEIKDAVINADIENGGTYALWVRTRQYKDSLIQKNRSFNICINGTSTTVGKYCYEGYSWEKAGEYELNSGSNTIVLDDKNGYYARFDCMVLTQDLSCQPSDIKSEVFDCVKYYNRTCESVKAEGFPEYANNVNTETIGDAVQIKNENIEIKFYNQNDTKHNFVQNEVFWQGVKLKDRSDSFGRLLRSSATSSVSNMEIRKSPFVSVTSQKAFNTYENDTTSDVAWGVDANSMWTNIISLSPAKYAQQSITVKLNIPSSGKYYAITRGYAYDSYIQRGYTATVDGNVLTSNGKTHYFNVTNTSTLKKFIISHNTDPIVLEEGEVTVTLQSGTSPMRTSFFALVPANSEEELEEIEAKLTSYDELITIFGGEELSGVYSNAPKSSTQYPYPITYNYVLAMNGGDYERTSSNMYNMGNTEWLIPQKAIQTDANTVTVKYENDKVILNEVWSLESGDEEPKVSMNITAKREGNYSVIIPSQAGYANEDIDYLFLPMMYRGHGFYDSAIMMTEQMMFTPMVSVTLPKDNAVAYGSKVTYGFSIEPSWIEDRWVYKDNYKYAATLGSPSGSSEMEINPSITVPAAGAEDCVFEAGEEYSFEYRPIYRTDDWYTTFSHVLMDLYDLRDYRRNYYNSVTDAVLNATDVMMDEFYSGWDDNSKAYWNMEGRNIATNAAPLEALQKYYLTDSKEILEKRTIPTVINTLTRPAHFRFDDISGGSDGYVGNSSTWPTEVGSYSSMYGADVFGAIYEASGKTMPWALSAAEASANKTSASSTSGKDISRLVGIYKTTKKEEYLDKAKRIADNYLKALDLLIASKEPLNEKSQAYASYMPYLAGLMDIYSVTGDEKYLDAAEYAGQVLLSLVWVPGIDGERADEKRTISKEYLQSRTFSSGYDYWWYGDKHFRVGNTQLQDSAEACDNQTRWNELEDDTVPSWVTSRVGIGLEAPDTFYDESINVIMASWAGDMMRLSKLTDNKLFETTARNAIVGRFGSYAGYSINRFTTYPMKSDYLTKSPIDFTSVYWHHIPAFLSMLEDFLISQAWSWSDGLIDFPYVRQEGYAYFNTNQYGFETGKFFGEDDMWLWLDRDIITIDSKEEAKVDKQSYQADWIAARKDGVMGIALMNESENEISISVTLGENTDSYYTGDVTLYVKSDAGNYITETVQANAGKFELTISGHSLMGVVIKNENIKAPSYADTEFIKNNSSVVAEHTDVSGKGMLMQFTPENTFSYIGITDKPSSGIAKIEVKYSIGKETQTKTVSDDVYPYEVIIPMTGDEAQQMLRYSITEYDSSGGVVTTSAQYELTPYAVRSFDVEESDGKILCSFDEDTNICNILFNAEDYTDWQGEYQVFKVVYNIDGSMSSLEVNEVTISDSRNVEVNVDMSEDSEKYCKIFIWTDSQQSVCVPLTRESF